MNDADVVPKPMFRDFDNQGDALKRIYWRKLENVEFGTLIGINTPDNGYQTIIGCFKEITYPSAFVFNNYNLGFQLELIPGTVQQLRSTNGYHHYFKDPGLSENKVIVYYNSKICIGDEEVELGLLKDEGLSLKEFYKSIGV